MSLFLTFKVILNGIKTNAYCPEIPMKGFYNLNRKRYNEMRKGLQVSQFPWQQVQPGGYSTLPHQSKQHLRAETLRKRFFAKINKARSLAPLFI